MPEVKYFHMFKVFFKIGLFTIGGGLAMIPVIRHEFVEKQHWISDDDVTDVLALSQSMPGVIAINASTFLGYRLAGIPGAIVSTLGVVLPSFIIILLIAALFTDAISNNQYVTSFFAGINAALAALLFTASLELGKKSVKDYMGCAITAFSALAISVFNFDIALVVLISGLAGFLYYRHRGADDL